jgi:hypothetical protein
MPDDPWFPLWFPEYGNRGTAHALRRNGAGRSVCDDRIWISPFHRPGFRLYDLLRGRPGIRLCAKCVLRLSAESREPLLELAMR